MASSDFLGFQNIFLCIGNVLNTAELQQTLSLLSDADFVDGALTASWNARFVKNNRQLPEGSLQQQKIQEIVFAALEPNFLFQMAARPKLIHSSAHFDQPLRSWNVL